MKSLDVPQSGKRGNVVASRNRSGPYQRNHTPPRKWPTAAQEDTQGEFRAVAKAWAELSDERYEAWNAAAQRAKSKPRFGKRWPLTGQTFFGRINNPRAAFGRPLLLDPPPSAQFGPNPVRRLIITNRRCRITLQLELSEPPTADIMVFGSRPRNRCVSKCFKCPRIGPLPAPAGALSDITSLYVNKHGKPPVGKRIFIRTRQYLDGGQDSFQETSAVVPAEQTRGGHAKEA